MLLYASEIWGLLRPTVIESAHLFACKRLLSVSDKTPNHMVYGETGRYPLYIDSTISSLRYWLRLSNMTLERLPKQAFIMLQNSTDMNYLGRNSNWARRIRDCLYSYGFHDVWTEGRVENEKAFLLTFKRKMIDHFKQEWKTKLFTSNRFSTYCVFKTVHQPENYLNDITIKKFRDSLIRLRLGINELRVNVRYQRDSSNNNSCPFCPDALENEYHLFFECPVYDELRQKTLSRILWYTNSS